MGPQWGWCTDLHGRHHNHFMVRECLWTAVQGMGAALVEVAASGGSEAQPRQRPTAALHARWY